MIVNYCQLGLNDIVVRFLGREEAENFKKDGFVRKTYDS
jgi:hypothetical protein